LLERSIALRRTILISEKEGRRLSYRDQAEQRWEVDEVELNLHAVMRVTAAAGV